jgi:DNA-binding NtrC family response regulator
MSLHPNSAEGWNNLGGVELAEGNLRAAVEKGVFRRDLYHRLDQARLEVPPLRTRLEDIEALALHFLEKEAPHMTISPAAIQALRGHSWPGNVRELRNTVVKAALLAEGCEIGPEDLPAGLCRETAARSANANATATGRTLDELEQQAIYDAISETGGRQDRAARILGISQRTLIRKLKLYESIDARREDSPQLEPCSAG